MFLKLIKPIQFFTALLNNTYTETDRRTHVYMRARACVFITPSVIDMYDAYLSFND